MTTITATSVLSSRIKGREERVDTVLLRYPRFIHAELMTHRMFSRNAASSRAIPVSKLIQDVIDDPAVPIYWGANEKGMQAHQELPEYEKRIALLYWLEARDAALVKARALSDIGAHKQIANRVLEPFSHITVLVSSTNWSNFLALRDHPDAEPHIHELARQIDTALKGAEVQELKVGDWHLPFVTSSDLFSQFYGCSLSDDERLTNWIKLSVARCASTSYKTVDGFDMTLERAVELHDKLVGARPLHASPCEHICQADQIVLLENGDLGWQHRHEHGNFVGFRQYRKQLPGECQ